MQIKTFKPKDHKIKALIYGAAGAGKTVFTGTASKAIYASAEGGLLSIADKKPQFVEVKTLKDLVELYAYLSREEHDYETVVIDSITEINEIIKLEIENRIGRAMQIQDWGELSKKIRDLFRKFRDLPMNVILIAQEAYLTDEDKIKKIVPSLNGKAATEIAYFMDVVGYINVENDGTRWIETDSNKKLLTKDRTQRIGNDTAMDFAEWQKKVESMDVGEQEVNVEYQVQSASSAPVKTTNHLAHLKKALFDKGAKTKTEALKLLNKAVKGKKGKFTSLDTITESEASSLLISILSIKK